MSKNVYAFIAGNYPTIATLSAIVLYTLVGFSYLQDLGTYLGHGPPGHPTTAGAAPALLDGCSPLVVLEVSSATAFLVLGGQAIATLSSSTSRASINMHRQLLISHVVSFLGYALQVCNPALGRVRRELHWGFVAEAVLGSSRVVGGTPVHVDVSTVRFLNWSLSTPAMVMSTAILAGTRAVPLERVGKAMVLDIFMLLCGFAANMASRTDVAAAFLLLSTACFVFVMAELWDYGKIAAQMLLFPEDRRAVENLSVGTLCLWSLFPAAWLSVELGLIDPMRGEFIMAVVDVLSKAVFTAFFHSGSYMSIDRMYTLKGEERQKLTSDRAFARDHMQTAMNMVTESLQDEHTSLQAQAAFLRSMSHELLTPLNELMAMQQSQLHSATQEGIRRREDPVLKYVDTSAQSLSDCASSSRGGSIESLAPPLRPMSAPTRAMRKRSSMSTGGHGEEGGSDSGFSARSDHSNTMAAVVSLRNTLGNALTYSELKSGALRVRGEASDPMRIIEDILTNQCADALNQRSLQGRSRRPAHPDGTSTLSGSGIGDSVLSTHDSLVNTVYSRDSDIPRELFVDPRLVRACVTAVLSNAYKFTAPGSTVETRVSLADRAFFSRVPPDAVSCEGRAPPDATAVLVLDVFDKGPGIAADQIERAFQPFVQLQAQLTDRPSGTGIGLTIARDYAELGGGSVSLSPRTDSPGLHARLSIPVGLPLTAEHKLSAGPSSGMLGNIPTILRGTRIEISEPWPSDKRATEWLIREMSCYGPTVTVTDAEPQGDCVAFLRNDDAAPSSAVPATEGSGTVDRNGERKSGTGRVSDAGGRSPQEFIALRGSAITRVAVAEAMSRIAGRAFDGFSNSTKKGVCETPSEDGTESGQVADPVAPTFNSSREPLQRSDVSVLVVDDVSINRRIVVKMLKKKGVEPASIDEADNGEVALRKWTEAVARGRSYHLIFMDVSMPVMNGIDATCAIRERAREREGEDDAASKNASSFILGLTAHVESETRKALFAAGANDVIYKPISIDVISTSLDAAIDHAVGV